MSNSSLLDENNSTTLAPIVNTQTPPQSNPLLDTPKQSIGQRKAASLVNTSANKATVIANRGLTKVTELGSMDEQIAEINAARDEAGVNKLDAPTYRKIVNTMVKGNVSTDVVREYLSKTYQMSEEDANNTINSLSIRADNVRKKLIDPDAVGNRSGGLLGDLGVAAVQGARQNLELPIAGIAVEAGQYAAALLPQELEDKFDNASNKALAEKAKSIEGMRSLYSWDTEIATQDKEQLIAEFEKTAAKEYPNGFTRWAAGVLKSTEGFYENPRLLAIETAKQLPNAIGVGAAGSVAKGVLTRGMDKDTARDWLANEGKDIADKVTGTVGITYTAAQEGLSNGIDAKIDVLDQKHEDLLKTSPKYAQLIDQGKTPDQARNMLSDDAFDIAFGISAAVGAVTSWGFKTGKLEANSYRDSNVLESMGRETGEETIQGLGGAFAGNLAEQQTTNPEKDLQSGLGVASGEGAILGGTSAGVLGTTASAVDGSLANSVRPYAQMAARKLNVQFNGAGNEFTPENYKAVVKRDYSNLKGDTIERKIASVTDKRTMALFNNDYDKISAHINSLAEIVDKDFTAAMAALPADADIATKRATAKPYFDAGDKLQSQINAMVGQLQKQAKETPLPEDATDEEKAARILTFGSMSLQDETEFDSLANLANSSNVSSETKAALTSLGEVRETLSELRSSGSGKGMKAVAKEVLEGTKDWRGIQTYVNNILGAMSVKAPASAKYNLRELGRFRDNRKRKFDLAASYVNSRTAEAREAAGALLLAEFNSEQMTLRNEKKQPLITKGLLAQIGKEYFAVESAYSGMANVLKSTQAARVVEAAIGSPATNQNQATQTTVPTETTAPVAPVTATTEPAVTAEDAPVFEPVNQEETSGVIGFTEAAPDFDYVAPREATEVAEIEALNTASTSTPVAEIEEDPVQETVEETTTNDGTQETTEEVKPTEKDSEPKITGSERKRRTQELRNNPDAPKNIREMAEGSSLSTKSLLKAEKAANKNKASREAREASQAERKARSEAQAEVAAKVKAFKPVAYEKTMNALMTVSKMGKANLQTVTKGLVDTWKKLLEKNSLENMLQLVDAYTQGIRDAAVMNEPLEDGGKLYVAGFKMGKTVNASVNRGTLFLTGLLQNEHRPELNNMLVAVGRADSLPFMKAADPLQYVLDYLDGLNSPSIAIQNTKQYLIDYVATFDATLNTGAEKGNRLLNPKWAAFSNQSVQMLRKEDGTFPVALKVAFAIQSLDYLTAITAYESGTRKEVASRLGVKSDNQLTDFGYALGLEIGNSLNLEVESLGGAILAYIGVGAAKSFNNDDVQKFIASTGQLAFTVLENMELVQVNYISVLELAKASVSKMSKDKKGVKPVLAVKYDSKGNEVETGLAAFASIKRTQTLEGEPLIPENVVTYTELIRDTAVADALAELFETDVAKHIPTTTKPTMKDVPKKYKGTNQNLSKEQQNALLAQMEQEWTIKNNTAFLATDYLTAEQVAILGGGIQDTSKLPKYVRDGEANKFKALVAEAKQTRSLLSGLKDTPFYMHLEAWRVGRLGYKNTLLNPQASKIARHQMSMKAWQRDVDMNNPEQSEMFLLGLAFNLGIDIDKQDDPTEVIAKLTKLVNKPEFETALSAYQTLKEISDAQNDPDYIPTGSDQDAVTDFMDAMTSTELWGAPSWSKIEAIAEYAAMLEADGKPFKTSLMVEIDGITNGVMIANMLFGIYDPETLAKGGIFLKDSGIVDANGNPINDFVQWSKDNNNLDSYKTLANYTRIQYERIRKEIIEKGQLFIDGKMTLDEQKALAKDLQLGDVKNLSVKNVKRILAKQRAALVIVGSPQVNGLITKAWRKLAKDPLMTTNYGAGIERVIEKMLAEIITQMHMEIGNAKAKPERAYEIEQALNVMFDRKTNNKLAIPADPLEFELTLEDMAKLQRWLSFGIGNPMAAALQLNYGEYNERKDYLQTVIVAHEEIGKAKLEKIIQKWRDDNGYPKEAWPSEDFLNEAFESVKEFFTILPTAFSTDLDEGTVVNKLGKMSAEDLNNTYNVAENEEVSDELKIDKRVKVESELNNTATGRRRSITSFMGRKEVSSAGVGSLAYIVQGLDSVVALRLLGKYGVMNAHDGFGFAYDEVRQGANDANRFLVEAIQDHTLWANIREKHKLAIAEAKKDPDGTIAEIFTAAMLDQGINFMAESSVNISLAWEDNLDKIIDNITAIQQYYYPGTDYSPNKEEAVVVTKENISGVTDNLIVEMKREASALDSITEEEWTDIFGSLDTANTQFTPDRKELVSSLTVIPLFEQLVAADTVIEDEAHLDHLRKVLSEIVSEVLVPVEMEIASRDAVTSGWYDKLANKVSMRTARDSSRVNPQQSVGSVMTHEFVHVVVETALAEDSAERTMIDKLFKAVRTAFKDASELYPENATPEEKEMYDNIFDYVFRNTTGIRRGASTNSAGFAIDNTGSNYLSEFLAYGLTDKAFMQMINHPKVLAILNKPTYQFAETEGRSFLPKVMNKVTNWFITVFKRLVEQLMGKFYGLDKKLPSEQLFVLAQRLAGASLNHTSRLEKLTKMADKGNTKFRQALINWVMKPLVTWANAQKAKGVTNPLIRAVALPIRASATIASSKFTEALDQVALRVDLAHDNIAASLWRELKGATGTNAKVLVLHKMANKFVDQLRLLVRNDVVKFLRSQFTRNLTKAEKKAMNRVLVRGDVSSLVEYSTTSNNVETARDNVTDLIASKDKRITMINTIRAQLRSEYTSSNSGYYINMAKSLARKMHGIASSLYDTPDNANMIARIAGNTMITATGDVTKAEALIDVLVTLEYLQLQSEADLDTVSKLMRTERTGVFNTLDYHSRAKLDAFKTLFSSNKSLMRKGYIKEQFNPNVDIAYAATPEEEADLLRKGYELVGDVKVDKYDPNKTIKMFRSGTSGLVRYNAGTVSLTGTNAKGADISKVNRQREEGEGNLKASAVRGMIQSFHHAKAGVEGHTDGDVTLEPVFNEDGNVATYRYMMSQADKLELLDVNENYDENLAGTAASRSSKQKSEEINTKVAEVLWDDFIESYAANPSAFVEVSATTNQEEYREMYALFPTKFKDELKGYFKDGRVYVRKDHYTYLFGFRKWSVSELGKKQFKNVQKLVILDVINSLLRQLDRPAVRNVEQALQELAKMFKDVIVVKTGATLIANVLSNLVTLTLHGVNPLTIAAGHYKGWSEVNKYQALREEVEQWSLQLNSDRTLTKAQRKDLSSRILENKQRMAVSPVKELVDEGLYQTITEDIADTEGNYTQTDKITEWAAPVTDKIPNVIKDVADVLFMTHKTRMYKFLRNATQVSDFAARYVLHEHNMKKGMSKEQSFTEVTEAFVNYDLPTHKGMQYLNDMGLLLFTKYMIRSQKVMFKLLKEKPANVLGLATMQWGFGIGVPDIFEASLLLEPSNLFIRVNDPIDSALGVADLHLLGNGIM